MKFAHEFREALHRDGFPAHWVDSAVPYSKLKKCLKKIQRELKELGLDASTLQELLAAQATSAQGGSVPLACYDLDGANENELRPRLSVFVHLRDGVAVDATLTPASREFLQKIAAGQLSTQVAGDPPPRPAPRSRSSSESSGSLRRTPTSSANGEPQEDGGPLESPGPSLDGVKRVEVPLYFDAEFFGLLQSDMAHLDELQASEGASMSKEIARLGEDMADIAKPFKRFHKSDISRWREIFELYLDAQVFFSTQERDRHSRSSDEALQQLVWFQNEVHKRQLIQHFKLPASEATYSRFLDLNAKFLQNLKFQEINRKAVAKILKKFDKRTSLGASGAFPKAVQSRRFLAESVAKDLCAQLSEHVVSTVPSIADFSCGVCLNIHWVPIRLRCGHVFCVRCVVKLQRQCTRKCPVCREDVVMRAGIGNIDHDLSRLMEKYFKKETEEIQKVHDLERGKETFGESYEPSSCVVM